MRILVTGGTGYIGSHTCISLLEKGYDVTIVDNLVNSKALVVDRIETLSGKKVKFFKRTSATRRRCAGSSRRTRSLRSSISQASRPSANRCRSRCGTMRTTSSPR